MPEINLSILTIAKTKAPTGKTKAHQTPEKGIPPFSLTTR